MNGTKDGRKPWENGRLAVSDNGRFLGFDNGEPFFWQGDTGWLIFTSGSAACRALT